MKDDGIYESDNTSSIATAQLPVPQTRSSIRRNEYVNIPLKQVKTTNIWNKKNVIWNKNLRNIIDNEIFQEL